MLHRWGIIQNEMSEEGSETKSEKRKSGSVKKRKKKEKKKRSKNLLASDYKYRTSVTGKK